MNGRVESIDGPIISTADLPRQRELFVDVIGMQVVDDTALDASATHALFGVSGQTARLMRLVTPGSELGVWLVQFSPGSPVIIREGGVGVACNALKMIDFFTADRPAAVARLRAHGFELVSEGAHVDLPDGSRFLEAHAKGPDGVMIAAIEPQNVEAAQFVTLTHQVFSEVQSSSGPVSDFEPVRRFYEETLGVPLGFRYEFASESFSRMVGVSQTLHIRANNYGRVVEDVMLGIIHYGLPEGSYADLRDRARAPNRGIIGVRLRVSGLESLVARCRSAGIEIASEPQSLSIGDRACRTAIIRAPHGVFHWLIEH